MNKTVQTYQDALDHICRDRPLLQGHACGYIQIKDTDICFNLRCKCGEVPHADGENSLIVRCLYCKTVYMIDGHVEVIEILQPDEKDNIHETFDICR